MELGNLLGLGSVHGLSGGGIDLIVSECEPDLPADVWDLIAVFTWLPEQQGLGELDLAVGGVGEFPQLLEERGTQCGHVVDTAAFFASEVVDGVLLVRLFHVLRRSLDTTTHVRPELLPAAVEDCQDIDSIELGDCVQGVLERIAVLGLQRSAVAHCEHGVVHDAMAGVVDEDEGFFLTIFPVNAAASSDTCEERRKFFEALVLENLDVAWVRSK